MKNMYVCEKCGKQSEDYDVISECERSHETLNCVYDCYNETGIYVWKDGEKYPERAFISGYDGIIVEYKLVGVNKKVTADKKAKEEREEKERQEEIDALVETAKEMGINETEIEKARYSTWDMRKLIKSNQL